MPLCAQPVDNRPLLPCSQAQTPGPMATPPPAFLYFTALDWGVTRQTAMKGSCGLNTVSRHRHPFAGERPAGGMF